MQLHRKPKKKPETMPVFTEQPPVYNMILECICAGLFSAGFCVSFLHYGTAEVPLFWVLLCAAAAVLCHSLSLWKPFRKTALQYITRNFHINSMILNILFLLANLDA